MDIVYNCRKGDNEELRYSMRSVESNLQYDNLWVVGGKPSWYIGNYVEDVPSYPSKLQRENHGLKMLCRNEEIANKFILMHDDIFVIKPVDIVETWSYGSLQERIAKYNSVSTNSQHVKDLRLTWQSLRELGIDDPISYELHVPMPMEKDKLAEALQYKGCPRTIYGNLFGIPAIEHKDVKVYTNTYMDYLSYDYKNNDAPYISTLDTSFPTVYNDLLKDLFPDRSSYESPQLDSNQRRTD